MFNKIHPSILWAIIANHNNEKAYNFLWMLLKHVKREKASKHHYQLTTPEREKNNNNNYVYPYRYEDLFSLL